MTKKHLIPYLLLPVFAAPTAQAEIDLIAIGEVNANYQDLSAKQQPRLKAETGHLPIDNNPVENTVRPIAPGKKNWLFAGSERAGQRAAAIQTLLGTAKLNGLDLAAWLGDTLEKLPAWSNSRIDELLPFARPVEDVRLQDDNER